MHINRAPSCERRKLCINKFIAVVYYNIKVRRTISLIQERWCGDENGERSRTNYYWMLKWIRVMNAGNLFCFYTRIRFQFTWMERVFDECRVISQIPSKKRKQEKWHIRSNIYLHIRQATKFKFSNRPIGHSVSQIWLSRLVEQVKLLQSCSFSAARFLQLWRKCIPHTIHQSPFVKLLNGRHSISQYQNTQWNID